MSSSPSGGWFSSLGKGAKWLIGVIVVALVGALVTAGVKQLQPPEEVSARLTKVSIDRDTTLEEYAIRHGDQVAFVRRGGMMLLVAVREASEVPIADPTSTGEDTSDSGGTAAPSGGETTTPGGDTTTPGGDETTSGGNATPGENTTPRGNTTTPGGQTTDEGPVVGSVLDPNVEQDLNTGVSEALHATNVPNLDLGPVCARSASDPRCGLKSLQLQLEVADADGPVKAVSPQTVARRLAQVFRGTRTVASTSNPSKRELVGVTVNFNVTLTGFDGGKADVRWSLYRAGRDVIVPRDWLRNQRAVLLRGDVNRDSGSGEFWVPIPQLRGPFFIRVGVYDDHGTRLDYADTRHFR